VERTVKEVVPALKTNSEGLKKVLEELVKQYNSKQMELEKWKVRWNLLHQGTRLITCCTEEEQHPGGTAISVHPEAWELGLKRAIPGVCAGS